MTIDRVPTGAPLLSVQGISKSFGHIQALTDVSFDIAPGEVLALLGDNGAGKSTLIKILSGLYANDTGEIRMRGIPQRFHSPADAKAAGIATVYQDLALVDTRDVAANLFLGREYTKGPFIDVKRNVAESRRVLEGLKLGHLPASGVAVGVMSGGQRQAVAVARTVVSGAELIIMDEPTAALGVSESAKVMDLAHELRDSGCAVIIISHNLQQVWDFADRFAVLHLGRLAGIRRRSETTVEEIVQLIVYGAGEA
ncbi:ATP-binding cassette domain-containing protein [Agromyces sp. H66]|uniref:ATP-binding cassette domain-containing protein n=1 Tax=Agromyces sp. H66 TaxID=2529859 RepID=UPI0010AAF220|nr:ATP-binding cassette domain-containing protein [Agromyces sp. H66]